MSSHHIVKEKQEPALYLHDLGSFSEEYLGQLLEWSPTLIVNADIYEKVISLGLKVDVIADSGTALLPQENTRVLKGPGDTYNTVLNYLITEKYPAVNIIDEGGKLSDLSFYLPKINIVLFSGGTKSYAVKSGFKVWKPGGSRFSIEVISYFEATNLQQQTEQEFEVVRDGFVEFNFSTDYLLLTEHL